MIFNRKTIKSIKKCIQINIDYHKLQIIYKDLKPSERKKMVDYIHTKYDSIASSYILDYLLRP